MHAEGMQELENYLLAIPNEISNSSNGQQFVGDNLSPEINLSITKGKRI